MGYKFNPFLSNFDIDNTDDAFNYYKIASGLLKIVPVNTEMFVTDEIEINGDLVINGLLTVWDKDAIIRPTVTTITSDLTLTNGNDIVLCDASSNTVTVTLPAAASYVGKEYSIKAIDTTYAITVDANGSETIDGSLTKTILLNSTLKIISNEIGWYII